MVRETCSMVERIFFSFQNPKWLGLLVKLFSLPVSGVLAAPHQRNVLLFKVQPYCIQTSAMFSLLLLFGHKCISEIWGRLNRQHVVHIQWNIQLSDVLLTNGKSSQTGAQRGCCRNPEIFPLIILCYAFMWSVNGLYLCKDFSHIAHEGFITRDRIFVCFDSLLDCVHALPLFMD